MLRIRSAWLSQTLPERELSWNDELESVIVKASPAGECPRRWWQRDTVVLPPITEEPPMIFTKTHQLLAQEHIIKGPAHYRTTAPGNRGNPGPQGRHYRRRRVARAIRKIAGGVRGGPHGNQLARLKGNLIFPGRKQASRSHRENSYGSNMLTSEKRSGSSGKASAISPNSGLESQDSNKATGPARQRRPRACTAPSKKLNASTSNTFNGAR